MADSGDAHHFEFDLNRGIREQVVERLELSPRLSLQKGVGPIESGIYALYFKGELVYIGKAPKDMTKSGRSLRQRLNEHIGKLSGREHIALADMECRYLTFPANGGFGPLSSR